MFLADNTMTYYNDYEYNERYFIRFVDVDDNQWRISIQDPTFEGTATELTGAAEPIVWEGKGDESQDEVMCGSTGRIRLVCLDGQENIFTLGNLLPSVINDRRVQVLRYTNIGNNQFAWVEYWQGFIKPDIFSQDWDSTPYEIEIPIVSAVASMEFFSMPDIIAGTPFGDVTNIADLLRAVCICSGCDIRKILTNKPIYEDFNGQTQPVPGQSYNAHWTQGVVSAAYYYDISDGIMKPKTFKDVWENICYPYGKIQDCYRAIAVLMRWKDDAASGARMYSLPIWEDYENQVISTAVRFGDEGPLRAINMSDIDVEGTDNTFSMVSGPRSVKFSKDIDTSKDILELSDKFIKPSLPIGSTIVGNQYIEVADNIESGFLRYLFAIDKQYVNLGFATDWEFNNSQQAIKDIAFCRVAEVSGDENENTTSITMPLGLCFNANRVGSAAGTASVLFTLLNGVRSRNEFNTIKLSIKPYVINVKDATYKKQEAQPLDSYVEMQFSVQDVTTGKYLIKNSDDSWGWQSAANRISFADLVESSGEWVLLFNEDRDNRPNDNTLHNLRLGFYVTATNTLTGNSYGRMFASFKLEYVEYPRATNQSIAAKFAESIEKNGNAVEYGGSGEDLDISFRTQCGTKNNVIDGSVLLPFNSFCNAQTYIDTANREKIEIDAAKFEVFSNAYDFVSTYVVVKDGSKVFIPVAVGMNPRMNTIKLILVSTNVTKL